MNPEENETITAVVEHLKSDPALSAYVKKVDAGAEKEARVLYPFICVANYASQAVPKTIGALCKDIHYCSFEIHCETKNMDREAAYDGPHGILQLCEDAVAALRGMDFGAFDMPVSVQRVETSFDPDSGGTNWHGIIHVSALRTVSTQD